MFSGHSHFHEAIQRMKIYEKFTLTFHAVTHHPVMTGIYARKFIMHYRVITK
jgi:hypothetical protein